ncbi:MAG TPA: DUF4129 domain-containing protein [Anaerolineales bacterium]|nr:DUF4129 domain-containing protein [Anaerolineales bacterium]
MSAVPQTPSSARSGAILGNLLAAALMICFAEITIQAAHWIFPQWDPRGMLLVCTLVSIESLISIWMVRRLPTAQRQIAFYRLTEWGLILILLKLFTELRGGTAQFMANFSLWGRDFPMNIVTGAFVLNLVIVFVTWQFSALFSADLYLLELDEAVHFDERVRTTPVRTMVLRRMLYLGMAVLIMAGLMLQNIQLYLNSQPVPANQIVPAVVLFFVIGMALLSLTRYASLQSMWRQAGVKIPSQIPRRWAFYSALLIVFIAGLAILLPTHYGMGLFETVLTVIRLLAAGIMYVFALIVLLIALIGKFFNRAPAEPQGPILQVTPPPSMLPPTNPGTRMDLLNSVIFWVILIGLLGIALRQYILFNKDLSAELKQFKPLRWITAAWKRLVNAITRANKRLGDYVQSRLDQLRGSTGGPSERTDWNYINLRRLPPRQKIFYYYMALLKRAGETSLPRSAEQTPYEYARRLGSNLEEGKEGVQVLTDAFVEARYSQHDIPAEKASRTLSAWEALRHIFQQARNSPKDGSKNN